MKYSKHAAVGLLLVALQTASSQEAETEAFAGKYPALKPAQQQLVDDWFRRFSSVVEREVSPRDGYDNTPLSVRTTFNAVTHALMNTPLTDESGEKLAESALDLVDKLDTVAGKVSGAGGDKQFRLYVQLEPRARDYLKRAREFKRTRDNTVYHKGYPISYRGKSKTPSIQISIAREGNLADIDVDYRSSSFPAALINGHLTASNSDVRAGKNDLRHNEQWEGLRNWWRNLLGLPVSIGGNRGSPTDTVLARQPRIKGEPQEAVYDFLESWLVKQQPEEAIAYIDEQALSCMEVERGEPIDRGMVRFEMLAAMRDVTKRLGKPSSLADVSLGVRFNGPRAKLISQAHHAQFVLYDVREDLAEQFRCENRLEDAELVKPKRAETFGKSVMAVFRLQGPALSGETVATLWRKSNGYWKIISYDIEPQPEQYRIPDLRPAPTKSPELTYVTEDPALAEASRRFFEDWFIRKRIRAALERFSTRAYSCIALYRDDDTQPPIAGAPEPALRSGLERLADAVGAPKALEDAISAPVPNHPDLRPMRHDHGQAYLIASIPNYMGEAADCEDRSRGEVPDFTPPAAAPSYGVYYGVGFKLASALDGAAVFWTVWAEEQGEWKIVAYHLITP